MNSVAFYDANCIRKICMRAVGEDSKYRLMLFTLATVYSEPIVLTTAAMTKSSSGTYMKLEHLSQG